MGAPRTPLNPTTNSVGYTAKLITVTSVSSDEKTAIVTDRQNTQHQVSMLVQRSKGPLPAPGEAWLITQDLGSWNFAAFVATSAADFQAAGGGGTEVTVAAQPPLNPAKGDLWMNSGAGNAIFRWTGTIWAAVQLGTSAFAPQSVTTGILAPGAVTNAQIAPNAGIKASQVAFSAGDIGGSRIFTMTYAPTGMVPGDLWFNPAQGNTVSVWNGNQWIPLLFGAPAILPGSLTGAQLSPAAGIAASQVNFTASQIGGINTTISATQPSGPSVNDLWYDAANGYQLKQWNGVQWAQYQWGTQSISARAVTAELIAANTITAAELAAGIVYAGIIDGTIVEAAIFVGSVFEGTNWIQNSTGQFFYGSTPTTGNLAISIAPRSGNDATWIGGGGAGNSYPAGVTVFGPNGSYAQLNSAGLTIQNVYNAGGGFFPTTIISFAPSLSSDIVNVNSTTVGGGSGVLRFNGPVELYGTWTDINTNLLSPLTAALPGSFGATAETWHTMTLTGGWTVGSGGIARYKLNVDNTVTVQCSNLLPGTLTNSTAIWTIPTNYIPASGAFTQNFPVIVVSATAQGNTPFVAVRGTGTATLTIQNFQSNVTGLSFTITYALD